ncbi:MAG: hypothetical protein FD167_3117 [bacterium]|nr:MAG: hypothetical protein FD167_3117 [bacterium]
MAEEATRLVALLASDSLKIVGSEFTVPTIFLTS